MGEKKRWQGKGERTEMKIRVHEMIAVMLEQAGVQ